MSTHIQTRVPKAKSRLAVGIRLQKGPEEIEAARADLAAAKLEAYVARVVAEAPPLSPDQIDRVAALLRGR